MKECKFENSGRFFTEQFIDAYISPLQDIEKRIILMEIGKAVCLKYGKEVAKKKLDKFRGMSDEMFYRLFDEQIENFEIQELSEYKGNYSFVLEIK